MSVRVLLLQFVVLMFVIGCATALTIFDHWAMALVILFVGASAIAVEKITA